MAKEQQEQDYVLVRMPRAVWERSGLHMRFDRCELIDPLYLWYMDCGWRGSIVALASTEEEAHELMEGNYNYNKKQELEKHEIKKGLMFYDLGDC
jgi:hypothetical protein